MAPENRVVFPSREAAEQAGVSGGSQLSLMNCLELSSYGDSLDSYVTCYG